MMWGKQWAGGCRNNVCHAWQWPLPCENFPELYYMNRWIVFPSELFWFLWQQRVAVCCHGTSHLNQGGECQQGVIADEILVYGFIFLSVAKSLFSPDNEMGGWLCAVFGKCFSSVSTCRKLEQELESNWWKTWWTSCANIKNSLLS